MSNKAIALITIASQRGRSFTMPITPQTNAARVENIISNAPSVAIGLPHPGRKISIRTITMPVTASNLEAIFPYFILKAYDCLPAMSICFFSTPFHSREMKTHPR